ncbi:MAG: Sua5/YciO/YrdC/YwlC family protein, partial [Kangiellaceae bacterium]|nr:Sua5/YciO/YrdC/YwlC family protein [Kangiellaceae bacterium]
MKDQQLNHAIQCLKSGGVIAYPTESVFGLGCDANNLHAIAKILRIKKRDSSKGLILLVSDIRKASQFIQPLNNESLTKLDKPSDQATTWLLPKSSKSPDLISGVHPKIAIRITTHPIAQALCKGLG